MLATFWLLGLVLGPAQAANRPASVTPTDAASQASASKAARSEWVLMPRLTRGQELVYRGTFTEQATGTQVQFNRDYRFETRFFVLETPPRGVNLAALTRLQVRVPAVTTPRVRDGVSSAVRLERLRLDLSGRVLAEPGTSLAVPLDGAPSLEVGAFLAVPRNRQTTQRGWEVSEPGRPIQVWRLAGNEQIGGQNCLKLSGVQQTDEWDRPRGDRGAWRRLDTVWIVPRTGLAARVERIIEKREPARSEPSQRSVLRYDLESALSYPFRLTEDRRQEIAQALTFREAALPMLHEPGSYTRELAALDKRVAYHLENQPPTPYREAVLAVRKQVEAARRGEVLPVAHHETENVVRVAAVGEPAPDFVATEITGTGSARLSRWKGRPILLVFYHPGSFTAGELLHFAQDVHASFGRHLQVVGLSVCDDTKKVLDQRTAMKLGFPILHGGGMRISYGVDTTPRLVLIDATGTVRAAYTGWGRETAAEVRAELRRWLPGR
jgi:peroxiredoxin